MENLDPYSCILQVDLRNAFNVVSRSAMIGLVHKHLPKPSNLVEFLYIQPGHLRVGRSSEIISLCVSVQQGFPLAPLLFCLVLKEITNKFRNNDITSLWYLDDGNLEYTSHHYG